MIGHLYLLLLQPDGGAAAAPVAASASVPGAHLSGPRPRRKVVSGWALPPSQAQLDAEWQAQRRARQCRQLRALQVVGIL